MKETRDLYRAMAIAIGHINGVSMDHAEVEPMEKEERKRCVQKRRDCRNSIDYPSYDDLQKCIADAISEAFENAEWDAAPAEIICAARDATCKCEEAHEKEQCQANNLLKECLESTDYGDPCPHANIRPSGDCEQVPVGTSPGEECSWLCRTCRRNSTYEGCGGITPVDDTDFWNCEYIRSLMEQINSIKISGSSGGFQLTKYNGLTSDYKDCKNQAEQNNGGSAGPGAYCAYCDCKDALAKKLAGLMNKLRRVLRTLGCATSSDDQFLGWYNDFNIDECKASNCNEETSKKPILVQDSPETKDEDLLQYKV